MKKILYKIIACLLIPSFVFAQPYPYQSNEKSIRQTDLSKLLKALETDVGKEIITYVETTVGNINLEQAKSFTIAKEEIAFVPIKSFSKILAALCYRRLEDGSEYLFLITYSATKKEVSFTFPSGQMYVMKSSGVTESVNPDFQFQQYDDLSSKVSMNGLKDFFNFLCDWTYGYWLLGYIILALIYDTIRSVFTDDFVPCFILAPMDPSCDFLLHLLAAIPLIFVVLAYSIPDLNLEILKIISIIFAVYLYGCTLYFFGEIPPYQ
jgi:hypothetical protein